MGRCPTSRTKRFPSGGSYHTVMIATTDDLRMSCPPVAASAAVSLAAGATAHAHAIAGISCAGGGPGHATDALGYFEHRGCSLRTRCGVLSQALSMGGYQSPEATRLATLSAMKRVASGLRTAAMGYASRRRLNRHVQKRTRRHIARRVEHRHPAAHTRGHAKARGLARPAGALVGHARTPAPPSPAPWGSTCPVHHRPSNRDCFAFHSKPLAPGPGNTTAAIAVSTPNTVPRLPRRRCPRRFHNHDLRIRPVL